MTMQKTILITGSTDGIGLETARRLVAEGHHVLVHGRSAAKVDRVVRELSEANGDAKVEGFVADLSRPDQREELATAVSDAHASLDALINNAGVFSTPGEDRGAFDLRFNVNTLAPYVLTKQLLPLLGTTGRVVNVSSAAQAPFELTTLRGEAESHNAAYAQSKLALTTWSHELAQRLGADGPIIVAVNPGSLLGTNMVKTAYGIAGGDVGKGADILCRAALSDEFAEASGKYFDNDTGRFGDPHPDAVDPSKGAEMIDILERLLAYGA